MTDNIMLATWNDDVRIAVGYDKEDGCWKIIVGDETKSYGVDYCSYPSTSNPTSPQQALQALMEKLITLGKLDFAQKVQLAYDNLFINVKSSEFNS